MKKLVLAISLVIASLVNVFGQTSCIHASNQLIKRINDRDTIIGNTKPVLLSIPIIDDDANFKDKYVSLLKDSIRQSNDIEFLALGVDAKKMIEVVESGYGNAMFDSLIINNQTFKNFYYNFTITDFVVSTKVELYNINSIDTLFYIFEIYVLKNSDN